MTSFLRITGLFNALLFLLTSSLYSKFPDFRFEQITEQQGLSLNCVSCILQDSKGFMWFGTEGGLNKYDGYAIQEYTHDPDDPFSLTHNFIRTFFEDPADSGKVLWIGTKGGGLNKYDRATDRFISYQHDPYDSTSLSHNEVKCIYKDSEGRYWIGTEGGGLNKFDRETGKFVWYKNNPNDPQSLSSDYVFSISEDHQGYLWIGGGGLDRFDWKTQQFRHYRYDPNEPEELPSHVVFVVHVDRKGELWIGTRSGLRKYNAETDRVIRHKFKTGYSNILDHALIYSIFEDSRGGLWIATHGNGLYYISPERDKFINYQYDSDNPNSLGGDNISSIYQDQSGIIWVGTYCSGITKMLPIQKEFKHYQHLPGDSTSLSRNSVSSIYEDGVGNLWVGTDGGGLNKFDRENGTFTHYQFDAYNNVVDICGTKSGELWVATRINLTRFNPHTERFVNYHGKFLGYHPKVLALVNEMRKQEAALVAIQHVGNDENIVRAFEISRRTPVLIVAMGESDGNGLVDAGWLTPYATEEHLWDMQFVKTKHAGGAFRNRIQLAVMVLNPGKYQLHYRSNAEHSYGGWKYSAPDDAELWGVAIFPLSREEARRIRSLSETEYFTSFVGPEGGEVVNVYEDRSGVTWCIMRGNGPFQLDRQKKQFSPYEVVTSEPISKEIFSVYQDRNGRLWFGTFGKGLVKRTTSSFRRADQEKYEYVQYQWDTNNPYSISSNNINSICEDRKGFLWIGTDNGLNKFDQKAETFIRYSDKDGLPSNSIYGILEDNKGHLWICTNRGLSNFNPETQVFKNYTVSDGLPNNVLTSSVLCKSESGEIFLGGNGLNAFHPDSLRDNQHIPPVVITDFQLFNKSVLPGNDSPLRKSIWETKAIVLSHEQNVISFAFAALDFINPSKNKYAYKMEGIDRDWAQTDASRRFVTYAQLDPGEYTFHVKGSNNDAIWNEKGVSVKLIITPPWWQTRWAYAFFASLFITLVLGAIRFEVNRHKRKAEARLREEQERRKLEAAEYRAAVAELQAQAAEAQKEVEKEQMRSRIAGDLHDEIGSNLSSIAIISQMLEKKLQLLEPERQRLSEIPCIARATAESMRDIIWFVNPENDSMEKLMVKMRQTANLMLESLDFTFHTPAAGVAFIADVDFRRHLYLIYKEILQNIVKHAQATKVKIEICGGEKRLQLRVTDNGVGFDTAREYLGNGLKNFQRRAREMGGTIEVTSSQGNGTNVTLTVKIP